jgi:hypothetical protein
LAQWWGQRKQFMSQMFDALREKVEASPAEVDWVTLGRALFQIMDERHVQVWLADPNNPATQLLAEHGWDGAIRQHASDFLLVVDTNMGFNKASAAVKQRIEYDVAVDNDGSAQATLSLRYNNQSEPGEECDHRPHYGADYAAIINRCYWDYVRVYTPAGTQILEATAHPISADLVITNQKQPGTWEVLPQEKGKNVFGAFFVLPRGQELKHRMVYLLPDSTVEQTGTQWRYRLLVQKQAGTHAIPLKVTVALPQGAVFTSIKPPEETHSRPVMEQPESAKISFGTTLDEDRLFEVHFMLEQVEEE